MPINQMRPASQPRSVVHELALEERRALGDQTVRIGKHQIFCNVDYLKVAALDALEQTGCKYLAHTQAVDAVVGNNRIVGVVVGTKQGLATIHAKAIVDCTGDADVAFFAGAETMKETRGARKETTEYEGPNDHAACGHRGGMVHSRSDGSERK